MSVCQDKVASLQSLAVTNWHLSEPPIEQDSSTKKTTLLPRAKYLVFFLTPKYYQTNTHTERSRHSPKSYQNWWTSD